MNILQMLAQLKSNPMAILKRYGVPQDIANDPNAVIQHLMNNGVVSQAQYNNAVNMAQNMGFNKR